MSQRTMFLLARAEADLNAGRFDAARAACDEVFATDPGNLGALWTYTHATKFSPDDTVLARIQGFAAQSALADPLKSQVLFMLGKAYDDLGRTEDAFDTFVEANARKGVRVDNAALDALTDALLRAVRTARDVRLKPRGPTLVFVLGMPRSGTSLTAQMLGAHPAITNFGERVTLGPALSRQAPGQNPHLAFLDGLDAGRLRDARTAYLDGLPETGIVIDKMPENYWFAWAIPMLFPDALILHMQRDRRATCWSCFRNDFRQGHAYSYDWTSLGKQYDRHLLLADLGRDRCAGAWFDIRLDDLTADPKAVLTPVLAKLGLEWNAAIAHPETSEGAMPTLSKWQVRQGIDPRISAGWRAYEPLIETRLESARP